VADFSLRMERLLGNPASSGVVAGSGIQTAISNWEHKPSRSSDARRPGPNRRRFNEPDDLQHWGVKPYIASPPPNQAS